MTGIVYQRCPISNRPFGVSTDSCSAATRPAIPQQRMVPDDLAVPSSSVGRLCSFQAHARCCRLLAPFTGRGDDEERPVDHLNTSSHTLAVNSANRFFIVYCGYHLDHLKYNK